MRTLALRSSGTARPGPNTFSRRVLIIAAPAADAADRCPARRPSLVSWTGTRPRRGAARSQARLFRLNPSVAQCRPGCVGTHPQSGTWRPGAARRCAAACYRVGAVIGGNGSGDLVSATLVDGHSSGVPRSGRGPPAPGVGTNIPVARKGSCETGLSWGMVLDCQMQHQFPGSAGCSWPALTGGLWHF